MQYQSPFHIVSIDISSDQIRFERKKLLAKFALGDNHSFIIKGRAYTKSEMLTLLDELEDERKMDYHKRIFQTTELLDFLEDGKVGRNTGSRVKEVLAESKDFIGFVSPYFAFKYSESLFKAWMKKDNRKLSRLKKLPVLCTSEHYDSCFSKTRFELISFIDKFKEEVDEVRRSNNIKQFKQYYYEDYDLIYSLDKLPQYFSAQIDDYVFQLVRIAISFINNGNVIAGKRFISRARSINCSRDTARTVEKFYNKIAEKKGISDAAEMGKTMGAGLVVFFILLIIGFIVLGIKSSMESRIEVKNKEHIDYIARDTVSPQLNKEGDFTTDSPSSVLEN